MLTCLHRHQPLVLIVMCEHVDGDRKAWLMGHACDLAGADLVQPLPNLDKTLAAVRDGRPQMIIGVGGRFSG